MRCSFFRLYPIPSTHHIPSTFISVLTFLFSFPLASPLFILQPDNKDVIEAAKQALDSHGSGLASVRFICGTQNIHKKLESKLSEFHNKEVSVRVSSQCKYIFFSSAHRDLAFPPLLSTPRTPSFLPAALTPTPPFSRLCWDPRMPSSATSSIMPASSTASDCVRC